MTPGKRAELDKQLNEQGLSVLLTKDFDSILIQLARLAQFERLLAARAEHDTRLADIITRTRIIQGSDHVAYPTDIEPSRPLEILDIPSILTDVHQALHDQLDKQATLKHESVHAATAAFIGILCRR